MGTGNGDTSGLALLSIARVQAGYPHINCRQSTEGECFPVHATLGLYLKSDIRGRMGQVSVKASSVRRGSIGGNPQWD